VRQSRRYDRAVTAASDSIFTIPTLRTERLVLRAFGESDLDAFAAMCADPEVMRYIGPGDTIDRAMAWRSLALFNGHWSLKGHGMWAVERAADGALLGRAGFLDLPGWPGLEVGWLLAREHWGRGDARGAAAASLRFGFDVLRRERLISMVHPDNLRSSRLAEALGARHEGDVELFGRRVRLYVHRAASAATSATGGSAA